MNKEQLLCKYLHILQQVKERRLQTFTVKEIADYLGVSERKMFMFEKGESVDYVLLNEYCAILGVELSIDIYDKKSNLILN